MKILLIEDEKLLQEVIADYLNTEGYVIALAADFKTAIEKIDVYDYDCLLVDITLPDGNGLDIIRHIKQYKPETGIIILSAKDSIDDKIKGLELGSDDYLPKPFLFFPFSCFQAVFLRNKKGIFHWITSMWVIIYSNVPSLDILSSANPFVLQVQKKRIWVILTLFQRQKDLMKWWHQFKL